MRRRHFAIAVIFALSCVTVYGYGPRVIRAEGALLSKPIVMSDWGENSEFYQAVQSRFTEPVGPIRQSNTPGSIRPSELRARCWCSRTPIRVP